MQQLLLLLLLLLIQSKWIQYASKHRQVSRLFVRYLLLFLFHQRQFWWCNAMHHRVYCQTNDMTNASVWQARAKARSKRNWLKFHLYAVVNQYGHIQNNFTAASHSKFAVCKFAIDFECKFNRRKPANIRALKTATMKLVQNICQQITWINIKNEWCIKWINARFFLLMLLLLFVQSLLVRCFARTLACLLTTMSQL